MRWGLLAVVVALGSGFAIAACDSPQHDVNARFYIAPDASDDDPPPVTAPGAKDGGGVNPPSGDAASDALAGDGGTLALALPGWWRAAFTAAPWEGTASAGTSATLNLTAGTAPPTAGAALNGLATADFNGTNAFLTGITLAKVLTPTAFSGWALVNIDSINTNSTVWSDNDTILGTSGYNELGVYLRDDGAANVTVGLGAYAAGSKTVATAFAKNLWQLVQWRSNGTTMSIRVNGGSWASTDTGTAIEEAALILDVGRNPSLTQFLDGRIAEIGLTTVALTDADFDAVRAYASARYALSL